MLMCWTNFPEISITSIELLYASSYGQEKGAKIDWIEIMSARPVLLFFLYIDNN